MKFTTLVIIGNDHPELLKCYEFSQDPESKDYIIVMQYSAKGSLNNNLKEVAQMKWVKKLNLLSKIAEDLQIIHSEDVVHQDLHSGNIILDYDLNNAYISDLGLSSINIFDAKPTNEIFGVLPYIAPEILQNNNRSYTKASDIYAFGIIMTEMSTGRRPFDGTQFEEILHLKIADGLRPEFANGTPDCYIKLAKKCMDSNISQRPTAQEIKDQINEFITNNEIKKQFLYADKIDKKLSNNSSRHPDHMYTSKFISARKVLEAIGQKHEIPDDFYALDF